MEVLHFGQVLQPKLDGLDGTSDVADEVVIEVDDGRSSRRLCQAVTLEDWAAETDLQKVDHLLVDGGRPREHESNLASEDPLHLFEDKLVVAAVSIGTIGLLVGSLGGDCFVDEPLLDSCSTTHPRLHLRIHLVVEAWH